MTNCNKPILAFVLLITIFLFGTSCSLKDLGVTKVDDISSQNAELNGDVINLMEEYKVQGVGIGFIENGVLVSTEYYGEQAPNIPVTDSTMFNVASTTKAITSEVFLRLAAQGEVGLDDPISEYYVFADIVDDPRHKLLTPRMILTHRSGFRNWPYEYEDGKLAFVNDPGTEFGYSGIGFYILAKYLEEKMWSTFPHLVEEQIFKPLDMKNSSIVSEKWALNKSTMPVDFEGNYMEPYDFNLGYWNPADDMYVSVEDYSKFLISAMNNTGLNSDLVAQREEIISELSNDPIFGVTGSDKDEFYPPSYGYGLGWMIFDYGDGNKNIQHGGNDSGEAAMAYFHTLSNNGLIVFCNGGNGVFMLPKIVSMLDKEQKYTPVYDYILGNLKSN